MMKIFNEQIFMEYIRNYIRKISQCLDAGNVFKLIIYLCVRLWVSERVSVHVRARGQNMHE